MNFSNKNFDFEKFKLSDTLAVSENRVWKSENPDPNSVRAFLFVSLFPC